MERTSERDCREAETEIYNRETIALVLFSPLLSSPLLYSSSFANIDDDDDDAMKEKVQRKKE